MEEKNIIETKGKWRIYSSITNTDFEVGKTYKIKVKGNCLFAITSDKPTSGFSANEFDYTQGEDTDLWICTNYVEE